MNGDTPIPLSAPDLGDADIDAVLAVLRSPQLSLGPRLPAFEAAMARRVGVEHAVAVNSGTSALHLACAGLGLGPGDEVITSAFSFIASANPVLYVGARPIFADVEARSLTLDPRAVEAAITPRTRALMVVHIFGQPAPMNELQALAQRRGLLLIEDACEALGATVGDRPVGSMGAAGAFGFYPNKVITTGEGGVLTTDDAQLAERARCLRNQGRDARSGWFEHVALGYNYRLSDIACALGEAQLARLDEILEARARVAAWYAEELADVEAISLPQATPAHGTVSWFVYVVRLAGPLGRRTRDDVWRSLNAQGVGCGRYFAPIHLQPYYRERFGHRPGELPITEAAADRTLALPFHNRLTRSEVARVGAALRAALGGQGTSR